MAHARFRVVGFITAIVACACAAAAWADEPLAGPRFGDSTWVAPQQALRDSPSAMGPRVALPERDRGWETALRAPFRVAFFPFRMLAHGIEALGPLAERAFPPEKLLRKSSPKRGLSIAPDLIGATVKAKNFSGPGSKAALTATWTPPSNHLLRLRAHVGDGVAPVGFGTELIHEYRAMRGFWGVGNLSDAPKTYYARQQNNASVYVFTGKDQLRRVRVTLGVSDMSLGEPRSTPRIEEIYSPAEVPFLNEGSRVWWYGSSADFGALDDSLNPTLGVHFRPEVRRYAGMGDADVRYDQWRFEARGYVPVFAKRRVLAGRLVYEGVDRRGGSDPIPFYRLPESSREDAFAAYGSGRFRDNRLAIGRAEYRWEIMRPIWAVALYELGEVAPSSSGLTLRRAHPSIGGALRAKIGELQAARLEIARGHEGVIVRADLRTDF